MMLLLQSLNSLSIARFRHRIKKKMPTAMRATVMRAAIALPALASFAMGCEGRGVSVGLRIGAGGEAVGRTVLE